MKRVGVLPFQLGCTTSEPLGDVRLQLYLWIAEAICHEECELCQAPSDLTTIPLSNRQIQREPQNVYGRFWAGFSKYRDDADIIVVDISSPVSGLLRATTLLHLAQGISASIAASKSSGDRKASLRFVLMLPELPPSSDDLRKILNEFIREASVVVVADTGDHLPEDYTLAKFSADQYKLKLTAARGNPLELIKRKMVCRLGHFRRKSGGREDYCVRYFYDGRLCDRELPDLIWQQIQGTCSTAQGPVLLYHSPMSPWLEAAVLALAMERRLTAIDLGKLPKEDVVEHLLPEMTLVLIVALIDSGYTVGSLVRVLAERSLRVSAVVSVLATNVTDPACRVRTLEVEGDTVEATYLLDAEQKAFLPGHCPMCKLRIPFTDQSVEGEHGMLLALDHWEMASQAGTKDEADVPAHRSRLGKVLDYPSMVDRHGAWLALKIRRRLELEGLPSDAIIVCPDEHGSRVFTEYLRLVLGMPVIRIPRDVIKTFVEGIASVTRIKSSWDTARPDWYCRLSSATNAEMIVMDEFNASGRTFDGLQHLLMSFGKSVMCYFPLNDLNPSMSMSRQTPVYTLYEWQSFLEH